MPSGFLKNRRGVLSHVQSGQLPKDAFCVFQYLLLQTNSETGICYSCSTDLSMNIKGLTPRQAQRALGVLERGGAGHPNVYPYIKRFRYPNSHGNYPILIHNFETREGLRTDAKSTTSEHHVKYLAPDVVPGNVLAKIREWALRRVPDLVPELVLLIGSQEREVIREREKSKSRAQQNAPSPTHPVSHPEKPKRKTPLQPQQVEYSRVNTLAERAIQLRRRGMGTIPRAICARI